MIHSIRAFLSRLTPGCNKDKSFTCTLFAPTVDFEKITGREAFVQWMKEQFPDAVPLIGETALSFMWERNPRSPLITVKVRYLYS
jgi:kynurenine 3-monooxygenase